MFGGQRNIDSVLARLPMRSDEEFDEEKFTKSQLRFFRRGLLLVSGGSQRVRLNSNMAACSDPVRLAFAMRFKERAMKMLVSQLKGAKLSKVIVDSLLAKAKMPWLDTPLTFRDVNGISEYQYAEEELQ
jgi:hypothetical protein